MSDIKVAIKQHMQKKNMTAEQMFKVFDADGGGSIDMHEFGQGAASLGITLTKQQLGILWPVFKPTDHMIEKCPMPKGKCNYSHPNTQQLEKAKAERKG